MSQKTNVLGEIRDAVKALRLDFNRLEEHVMAHWLPRIGYSEQRLAELDRVLHGRPFTSGSDPAENVEPVSGMSTLFTQTGRARNEHRQMDKAIRLGLGYQTGRYVKEGPPFDIYRATAERMLAQSQPFALHKSWMENPGVEPDGLTRDSMVDFRLSNGHEVLNQLYGTTQMAEIWRKEDRRVTCTHWRFSAAAPREQLTVPGGLEWDTTNGGLPR